MSDSESNPQTPVYSQAKPVKNDCESCGSGYGLNIIKPPVEPVGKTTEILAGFAISVTDLSDSLVDRFRIDYNEYVQVDVLLSIAAYVNSILKTSPILKGTIVDEIQATWAYNAERDGDIASQTIDVIPGSSDPDPTNPTLGSSDRNYDYTSLALSEDADVKITGTDGITSDNDTKGIIFGNYLAVGVYTSLFFEDPDDVQDIFDSLASKAIKTTQDDSVFNAYGDSDEHMIIMYPKAWGESEFTKGVFTGGYFRLKKVTRLGSPVFTVDLLPGETEEDILISNNNPDGAYSEEYYIYMSEYPARTADQPTIITKV